MFNGSGSTKGAGINLTLPLRNRQAQAQAGRAQLEHRQSQMLLQQTYLKVRMNVTNQIFALQSDRAQVQAAQASLQYATQAWMQSRRNIGWVHRPRPMCWCRREAWRRRRKI